ncbi:MAG TPA: hypothetical protein PK020_09335 [Ilumatobacteraceae bacterium]|nr:hypothetical protein [Ilumatobacteraceae bacterium]HRB05424.1 hypothetical protein [Ilumatobacteraceae bacterium]
MTSKRFGMTRAAAACAVVALTVMAIPGSASASIDQCVRKKVSTGMDTSKAMAECLQDANSPTKTLPPVLVNSGNSNSGGTSTGLLALVGVGGVALGAIATMMLRKPSGASSPAPSAPSASMPPPGFTAPAMQAPAVDRSRPLVDTLIDLSDRVSSGALRAEIIAALATAGVQTIEPAQGAVFDASQMRGVGSAPAPDPGWVGRVASTERAGFVDAGRVMRLPDVVVYTSGD